MPWSKYFLGWVTPTKVTGTLVNESIDQAETNPDVYQLLDGSSVTKTAEYFLVENRQKVNFDAGLPSAGILIWHIDESMATTDNKDNASEWYPGCTTCLSTSHYRVALVQADNSWDLEKNNNSGDAGDPFPGTCSFSTCNTFFDSTTSPNSNLYSGSSSGISISNISASGSEMIATLGVSGSEAIPIAKAGSDRVVPTGSLVMLDGTGSSDPGGKALSYTWSLLSKPAGSGVAIADSKKAATSFKADADGVYIARLVVDNGQKPSSPDSITIWDLGSNTKIQVVTNKSHYKVSDLLKLYLWLGNGVSEPVIKADAFIGFGFPDGRLFFFDASGNLREGNPLNPRTFNPIAQSITLPVGWVFPGPIDMDADSDGNGKFDAYCLLSAPLLPLPPGEYFAFAALVKPGSYKTGEMEIIGDVSIVKFDFHP